MSILGKLYGGARTGESLQIAQTSPTAAELAQAQAQQQALYNHLIKMGASMAAGSPSVFTPQPPPAPKPVGGDHPWQSWNQPDEMHGLVNGFLYKDLFIPRNVADDAQQELVRERGFDGYARMAIVEVQDWIYLGARKLLIIGS